jgi:hypothetical protein
LTSYLGDGEGSKRANHARANDLVRARRGSVAGTPAASPH